mmetsp:Transcript_26582/g.48092  ORF Transcript_26582/g.48092 Transcript_26582/m.48092 type:complete len:1167 (+) Transcript_26582:22-3522(+)
MSGFLAAVPAAATPAAVAQPHTMARAPSHGAARTGSSAAIPAATVVPHESGTRGSHNGCAAPVGVSLQAPQVVWRQCSGGSLPAPCHMVPRLLSGSGTTLRPTAAVRVATPVRVAVTGGCQTPRAVRVGHVSIPVMQCAGKVNSQGPVGVAGHVVAVPCVRDVSPGRPAACNLGGAEASEPLRSLSPVRTPQVTAPAGVQQTTVVQMSPRLSPPLVMRQRSVSPTPGVRPVVPGSPETRKLSPAASPQRVSASGSVILSASPQRQRSMSPPGLPSAPIFGPADASQVSVAVSPTIDGPVQAKGTQDKFMSSNSAAVQQTTPREQPGVANAANVLHIRTVPAANLVASKLSGAASRNGPTAPGTLLSGLRTSGGSLRPMTSPRGLQARPTSQAARGGCSGHPKRASSTGAVVHGPRSSPSVLPPGRTAKGDAKASDIRAHERRPLVSSTPSTGAGALPPRKRSGITLVGNISDADKAEGSRSAEAIQRSEPDASWEPHKDPHDIRFDVFKSAVDETGASEAVCRQLMAKLPGGGGHVRWEDLLGLDPVRSLLEAATAVGSWSSEQVQGTADEESREADASGCRGWWRALLARHGLYGPGNVVGICELSELVASALRMLRDRYAPQAYLRNLRTVHCGAHRLKDRYGSFEFVARGSLGKSYRCKSRLTREEHVCRQVRKERLLAPSDVVRAEVEVLRSLEHPHIPQVIESFEDFNNIYVVLEPVESVELLQILQQWHSQGTGLRVSWLAEMSRQLLEALRHCHELRPHSLVHGDLRLTSLLLSAATDIQASPHLVLSDIGLAGLPPPVPTWRRRSPLSPDNLSMVSGHPHGSQQRTEEEWLQCASPKLDIWSFGCLLFLLLSGHHPFGGDWATQLLPSVARRGMPPEPDWRLLPSAAAASICAQMLSWDIKVRPSAADCLNHSWISSPPHAGSDDDCLSIEALGFLLQKPARSKLQQVVAGLVISEQIESPFSSVSAAMAVQYAFAGRTRVDGGAAAGALKDLTPDVVTSEDAASALLSLGVSAKGIEKVVKAFAADAEGNSIDYGLLSSSCNELAEDLLDHALWRVFTAAGEDHRGVLSAAELEQALSGSGEGKHSASSSVGCGDRAGGEGTKESRLLGSELKPSEIVRQIASGSQEVTFEELKDAVIRQAAPCALKPLASAHAQAG